MQLMSDNVIYHRAYCREGGALDLCVLSIKESETVFGEFRYSFNEITEPFIISNQRTSRLAISDSIFSHTDVLRLTD